MKVTRYVYLLTINDRKRHEHFTVQGKVVRFSVQYETFAQGRWHPVIRYDTAHGFAHLDRIRPDGATDKIPLLTQDLGEALTFADQDINDNWERYKEAYLKDRLP